MFRFGFNPPTLSYLTLSLRSVRSGPSVRPAPPFAAPPSRARFSTAASLPPPFYRHKRFKYASRMFLGILIGYAVFHSLGLVMEKTFPRLTAASRRMYAVSDALIKCISHYKKTLGETYATEEAEMVALQKCHKQCARITLRAIEINGGIYIKLGQHLSVMHYLLPREWTETMTVLQDRCPRSSLEEIDAMFRADLGQSIDEVFSAFDVEPIGVASLAQVHTAVLRETGERVAVKVQHPSLQQFVPLDIKMTKFVFSLLKKTFPEYPLMWLCEELQESIYTELDFTKEAANAAKTAAYFSSFQRETALRVPEVFWAQPRVMVMEHVAGERLDNLAYLDEHHISRSEVSSCLSHVFNNMIFTPGVGIHCDPHLGNLAIRPVSPKNPSHHNFEIILYDHGLYRDVPQEMRRNYSHFWLAILNKDTQRLKHYAKKFANLSDEQFPIFAAAITGRDFHHAVDDVTSTRSQAECDHMTQTLTEGNLLFDLMRLLSTVPKVVLLILKTNELTRALDETLQNPLGPERTFLILATYCAKTVYAEDLERLNAVHRRWSLSWVWGEVGAWLKYRKCLNKLFVYDCVMLLRNLRQKV